MSTVSSDFPCPIAKLHWKFLPKGIFIRRRPIDRRHQSLIQPQIYG